MKQKHYWMALILVIILIFSISKTKAQSFQINKADGISFVSMAISGIADGYSQAIAFHHYGRGNQYRDIELSFKNKYNDFDNGDLSPAFFGSKTFLVAFTDAYHKNRMIDHVGQYVFIASTILSHNEYNILKRNSLLVFVVKKILIPVAVKSIAFEITYKNLGHH